MKTSCTKQAELKNIQEALAKKVEYNIKILEEMDKLNAIEQTPENKKNQQILQDLVSLNKNLKDQINLFKGTCQRERADWQKKIEEIKSATPDDGGRGNISFSLFLYICRIFFHFHTFVFHFFGFYHFSFQIFR